MMWFLIIPGLFVSHSIAMMLGFFAAALAGANGEDPPMPGANLN